jgi:hypothetical protein
MAMRSSEPKERIPEWKKKKRAQGWAVGDRKDLPPEKTGISPDEAAAYLGQPAPKPQVE